MRATAKVRDDSMRLVLEHGAEVITTDGRNDFV
jgi:hypothetical protein